MELGEPDERLSILHVAGSNGKGSVCADLTAILTRAGYRVGTFVSPHLVDIRERFLINGEMVGEGPFQSAFGQVYQVVQRQLSRGYCHPTFLDVKRVTEEMPVVQSKLVMGFAIGTTPEERLAAKLMSVDVYKRQRLHSCRKAGYTPLKRMAALYFCGGRAARKA